MKPSPGSRSGLKGPLGLLEGPKCTVIVFQDGDDGRGYRNMYNIAWGSKPDLGH